MAISISRLLICLPALSLALLMPLSAQTAAPHHRSGTKFCRSRPIRCGRGGKPEAATSPQAPTSQPPSREKTQPIPQDGSP